MHFHRRHGYSNETRSSKALDGEPGGPMDYRIKEEKDSVV